MVSPASAPPRLPSPGALVLHTWHQQPPLLTIPQTGHLLVVSRLDNTVPCDRTAFLLCSAEKTQLQHCLCGVEFPDLLIGGDPPVPHYSFTQRADLSFIALTAIWNYLFGVKPHAGRGGITSISISHYFSLGPEHRTEYVEITQQIFVELMNRV